MHVSSCTHECSSLLPCSLAMLCYAMLCSGNDKGTRGTAYVVYEDIYDAKQALEHLGGFNVQNRYLILQVNGRLVPRRVRQ